MRIEPDSSVGSKYHDPSPENFRPIPKHEKEKDILTRALNSPEGQKIKPDSEGLKNKKASIINAVHSDVKSADKKTSSKAINHLTGKAPEDDMRAEDNKKKQSETFTDI